MAKIELVWDRTTAAALNEGERQGIKKLLLKRAAEYKHVGSINILAPERSFWAKGRLDIPYEIRSKENVLTKDYVHIYRK